MDDVSYIYTTTVKLQGSIKRKDLRKIMSNHGVITWDTVYGNGVVRYDFCLFPSGAVMDIDTVPRNVFDAKMVSSDIAVEHAFIDELRVLCRGDEGGIEGFLKILGHLVDPSYKVTTVAVTGHKTTDGFVMGFS